MNNFVRTGLSLFILAIITALFCVILVFVPQILDVNVGVIFATVAGIVSVGVFFVLLGMHIELRKNKRKRCILYFL